MGAGEILTDIDVDRKNKAPFLGPSFQRGEWLGLKRDEELRSLSAFV